MASRLSDVVAVQELATCSLLRRAYTTSPEGREAPCPGASSMASCLFNDAQTRLRCHRVHVVAKPSRRFRSSREVAEMRRRVCEAKKEATGSEVSDGSQKVQKFATGRRDRSITIRWLKRGTHYGQIPAFGLYMSLGHPVSRGGWRVQACTTSQTDFYLRAPESCKIAYFPADGTRRQLSGLLVVPPSEVWVSCDAVRDLSKCCCSPPGGDRDTPSPWFPSVFL